MNVGMLWLDDDKKRPFAEKVERAAEYYSEKYGVQPDICWVNSGMFEEVVVEGVAIHSAPNILPHHYWIGVEKEDTNETESDFSSPHL